MPTPAACLAALEELLRLLQARLPDLQPSVHAAPITAGSNSSGSSAVPAAPRPSCADGAAAVPAAAQRAQREYHISLSRTVPLRLHQVEPLAADLQRRLK